ncbi:hypothetical protein RRG08_038506 [Elysia crispata]|uniref:Uncharacterized protein n=1 Tax=Elysia crispata TaxID=231223 RepID=A0AAE1DYV1_9GAST|nr:hypothetical protein RRG08_038506 [Elysia crispata]
MFRVPETIRFPCLRSPQRRVCKDAVGPLRNHSLEGSSTNTPSSNAQSAKKQTGRYGLRFLKKYTNNSEKFAA